MTDETQAKIAEQKAAIVDGSFYPLTGPLVDQSGKERIAEGTKMTLDQILSMDWFIKGVEGSPKG